MSCASGPIRLFASLCLVLGGALPVGAAVQWQTWEDGAGELGDVARISLSDGYVFAPRDQMPELNRLTGNLDGPGDMGALLAAREGGWIAFFVWDDVGFVSDDDKDELDADAMLLAFQDNDARVNEIRAERGFEALTTLGWLVPPYYDESTNNLTWGVRLRSEQGNEIINHNIRVLGRRGVMQIVLVDNPDAIEAAIDEFTPLLSGFEFNEGQRYAEYVEGDRLAAYGLTGLIVGGGAVLAAKTGLLGLLLKNLKVVIGGAVAALAAVGAAIRRMFGGGTRDA